MREFIDYSVQRLTNFEADMNFGTFICNPVNGPCLLDYLILKLRLPVVLYVSFAVVSG